MSTGISDSPQRLTEGELVLLHEVGFVLLVPITCEHWYADVPRSSSLSVNEIVREGDEPDSLFVLTSGVPESSSVAMAWTSCSAGSTRGGVR